MFKELHLTDRLARRLGPLAIATALIIGIGFPVLFFAVQTLDLREEATAAAQELSHKLREVVEADPVLWMYQTHRYMSVLREFQPWQGIVAIRVLDERGRAIGEYAYQSRQADRWWNRFAPTGRAPIVYNNRTYGTIQVTLSQGFLLELTLGLAVGCTIVGGCLAFFAYRVPMGMVRRMEGEIRGLVGSLQDSTAESERLRVLAEATAERMRLLAHALEHIGEAVTVTDPGGRLQFVNLAFEQMFGYAGSEMSGRSSQCLWADRNPAGLYEQVLSATRAAGWAGEVLFRAKDGREFPGVLTTSRLQEDGGAIVALIGIARDITERKRAEEALLQRNRQLEAMRAVSVEITRELDLQRVLELITRRAAELVDANSGSVYLWDETAGVLVPQTWPGMGEWYRGIRRPLGQGVAGTVAATRTGLIVNDYRGSSYACADDLERADVTAAMGEPLLYHDRLVGTIVVRHIGPGRPFTEADRTLLGLFATKAAIAIENARLFQGQQDAYGQLRAAKDGLVRAEKLRALGQMAAGIAHDLNNVLAAILGQIELLKLRDIAAEVSDVLALLETAATDGAQVVRRIQNFARQQATTALAPLSLAAAVREALEISRPRWENEMRQRGRTIDVHMALEGLAPILGHASEVREVLTTLILNAVDAMPEGGTLTLEGGLGSDGVLLAVRDSGVGMSEEIRRKIFEPFFTTKGVTGNGLGLSVAYAIMERHRGRIDVTSTPGAGTTFTLYFKRAAQEPPADAVREKAAPASPKRVCLIEDEVLVRTTTASLLRAIGHDVREAEDGAHGLAALADHPVDLVITDLGMPGMTGWEVAEQVKAATPHTPVILLTGWGQQLPASPGRAYVDRVIGKPVHVSELQQAIAELTAAAPASGAQERM
jgi:PAS domain S-box-containing protein